MNRRNFLKLAGGTAVAAIFPSFAFSQIKLLSKKPNFVFVLIDDMGWTDAGCCGSSFYETPNIDRLAKEGMRFTSAYAAAPVCSPTRASILAGKYPARLNLTDWLGPDAFRAKGKMQVPQYIQQLPLEEFTIAEALKNAGYTTVSIGKWHLGSELYYPEYQGFDINIGGSDIGWPPGYFYPYKSKNYSLHLPGGKPGEYLTDRLTDEAIKFIESNATKPFFLYLSHYAVHMPLQSKVDLAEKYKAKAAGLPASDKPRFLPDGQRQARQVHDHPVYAGMIQSVDESLGRVMKKLDEMGIADNTVLIFMSDNGGVAMSEDAPTSNVPLRAGKGWLYEGGIREPMIVKWPGTVAPGSICSAPVISTDFYPTMLEIADLPLRPRQHCDGVSFVPLLRQTGELRRDAIYWHYPHYSNQGGTPSSAVRAGDYKLIEFYEDGRIELYNLKDDISEKNDLAAKMPQKAAELRKMLYDWKTSVNAKLPVSNSEQKSEK